MVIIAKSTIVKFIKRHPDSEIPLLNWYLKTKESDWRKYTDIKQVFRSTDVTQNQLYIFNIGGNKYRLIARIIFKARTVYIRFIGTHAEYDKIKINEL